MALFCHIILNVCIFLIRINQSWAGGSSGSLYKNKLDLTWFGDLSPRKFVYKQPVVFNEN